MRISAQLAGGFRDETVVLVLFDDAGLRALREALTQVALSGVGKAAVAGNGKTHLITIGNSLNSTC